MRPPLSAQFNWISTGKCTVATHSPIQFDFKAKYYAASRTQHQETASVLQEARQQPLAEGYQISMPYRLYAVLLFCKSSAKGLHYYQYYHLFQQMSIGQKIFLILFFGRIRELHFYEKLYGLTAARRSKAHRTPTSAFYLFGVHVYSENQKRRQSRLKRRIDALSELCRRSRLSLYRDGRIFSWVAVLLSASAPIP